MKKTILLLTVFILFFLTNIKDEKAKSVFSEDESYSMYILEFPNKNLSTNNYNDYFLNKKIVWIEPYINELYIDKVLKYKRYNISNSNINKFKNEFIKYMDEIGYKNEAIKLKIDGIQIKKIKIYCTNNEIQLIKLKIDNVLINKIT